ncbi:restriction endonuclease subunit S [Vibrio parahaemolyticus]|nr:restriction endonuclease subunit S [Vibrio parahaemolyticus]
MPYSALEAKEIATLCTVVDCEHKTAPYVEKSDYLVVRTSNVRNGQLLMEDMKYTTVDGYNEWTQRAVPAYGDVLFTREAPAGESCLVPHDKKVCMGQRMVMLRPNKDVTDPIFLSLILNTERTKTDISRLSIGSTVSRINIADIKKLKVASPPLQEQRKIAQILSTWDRGIATTEKLIDASKQQKKALMQQLLTGKKRLIDPETGKVFEGEWETEQFDKLFDIEIGGTPSRSNETYWDDKLETNNNWLSIADLKGKFISRTKERISDLGVAKSNVSLIPKGTIVMSFKLTIGRRAFLNIDTYTNEAICALLIKNKDKLDNNYLYQALEIVDFEQEIDQAVKGKTLNKAKLKRLKLLMPSVKEQQKIASVLTAADKDIELLEAKLLHFKQEKKALMQQLLTGKRRVKVAETEAA